MGRIIGAAEDFYRLRVTRLDETDEPDLEWRDDILYRTPPTDVPAESEEWILEAVTLDDAETVTRIGQYVDAAEAHVALEAWSESLQELTKSQFEERIAAGPEPDHA